MAIDFLEDKSKAIAHAEFYLTINNLPDYPNAYVIGKMMFFATLRFYETATKAMRTKNELYDGWSDYFILKTLTDSPQFNDWLDFAGRAYIQRTDDFLPAGWPKTKGLQVDGGLGSRQNLLAACISFSWTFFWFIKDHFKSVENPGPQKATATILRELNSAFDNLAKTLRDVYDANIPSDLTKKCDDLLDRELGLYVRQLRRGKEKTIKKTNQWTKATAEPVVLEAIQKYKGKFNLITLRSLSRDTGISTSMLATLPSVKLLQDTKRKNKKPAKPKTIPFTPKMELIAGKNELGEVKLYPGNKKDRIKSEDKDADGE